MAPRWKLTVEALGKIEHASLDVRPLTLLVGPNNSGKSYLASLLWGLVAMQYDIPSPKGPERDACDTWLHDQLLRADQAPQRIDIPSAIRAHFAAVFQQGVDQEASRLVKRIFNAPSMEVGRVTFHNAAERPLYLATSFSQGRRQASITGGWDATGLVPAIVSLANWDEDSNAMLRDFLKLSITMDQLATFKQFHDVFERGDPAYLPASRTGFMLLYKSAARRSLRVAFRPEASEPATLDLDRVVFGTAFRNDRLSEDESPNPAEGMPLLGEANDDEERQQDRARRQQLAWMNDEVRLRGFSQPFQHTRIALHQEDGRGTYVPIAAGSRR